MHEFAVRSQLWQGLEFVFNPVFHSLHVVIGNRFNRLHGGSVID